MRYNKGVFLPDETEFTEAEDYPEDSRSGYAKMLDSELTKVVQWHANPTERLDGFTDNQYKNFICYAKNFIVDKGKLYRRDMESEYKLVIYPERRMYIMKAAHDQLGHRGMYATKMLIKERFWWPEMERDIAWTGHSPFFAVTGAHPILPLDVLEAMWLVEYPGRMLEDWELRRLRAIALEKHADKVEEMRQNMDAVKRERTLQYAKMNANKIKEFDQIESSLNTKMKPRYLGPLVVVHRTKVGNYILAELDGAIIRSKIAAFRVVPYLARKSIDLDGEVLKLMDMSHAELQKLIDSPEPKDKVPANFTDDYPETENLKVSKDINLDH
ncbi:uncharacterized protein ARMOST_15529 [Armillaria ostoyae]|uniref:Integrase zinc-binding domain-containing protein n=1 Tax=Armillaria ostoyae TaxID=47428 RepID=A0A284RTL4_ARMOS|nr:uncharacterized protein ARMOST_15529 [Armillaria ostoyae]